MTSYPSGLRHLGIMYKHAAGESNEYLAGLDLANQTTGSHLIILTEDSTQMQRSVLYAIANFKLPNLHVTPIVFREDDNFGNSDYFNRFKWILGNFSGWIKVTIGQSVGEITSGSIEESNLIWLLNNDDVIVGGHGWHHVDYSSKSYNYIDDEISSLLRWIGKAPITRRHLRLIWQAPMGTNQSYLLKRLKNEGWLVYAGWGYSSQTGFGRWAEDGLGNVYEGLMWFPTAYEWRGINNHSIFESILIHKKPTESGYISGLVIRAHPADFYNNFTAISNQLKAMKDWGFLPLTMLEMRMLNLTVSNPSLTISRWGDPMILSSNETVLLRIHGTIYADTLVIKRGEFSFIYLPANTDVKISKSAFNG